MTFYSFLFSGKSTAIPSANLLDITSPESEGSVLSKIVALVEVVEAQSKVLESLKELPTAVKSMQDKIDQMEELGQELEDMGTESDIFTGLGQSDTNIAPIEGSELLTVFNDCEDLVTYGSPILSAVSDGMQKAVSRVLPKEKMDLIIGQAKVPENCKAIGVPKVNPEIWNSLPSTARVNDLNLQKTQQSISYGLITMANIAATLAKAQTSNPTNVEVMQHVKNGCTLLGMGFQEVNLRRRAAMRCHITPEYSGICSM